MAYPNIPAGYGLVRHHFAFSEGNGHALLLFGVKIASGVSAQDVANDAQAQWGGNMMELVSSEYSLDATHVVCNIGGTISEADSVEAPTPGEASGNPMPPQVSVLLSLKSGLIGKHFRGRKYLPGLVLSTLDAASDRLTGSAITTLESNIEAWQSGLFLGTVVEQLVILHRSASITPTPVTQVVVNAQVATQRRRNRKAAHS